MGDPIVAAESITSETMAELEVENKAENELELGLEKVEVEKENKVDIEKEKELLEASFPRRRLLELKAEYEALEEEVERHLSLVGGSARPASFPESLLLKIFHLCLPESWEGRYMDVTVAPMQLMGVCRHWRRVVERETAFWTTIHLPEVRRFGDADTFKGLQAAMEARWVQGVDAWLARTHSRKLQVIIHVRPSETGQVLPGVLKRSKLWSDRRRWESLIIKCHEMKPPCKYHGVDEEEDEDSISSSELWTLLSGGAAELCGGLRTLDIEMDTSTYWNEKSDVYKFIHLASKNRLEQFSFRGRKGSRTIPGLLNGILASKPIAKKRLLTHLDLHIGDWYGNSTINCALKQILKGAPALVFLKLQPLDRRGKCVEGWVKPPNIKQIQHKKLRHLVLDTYFNVATKVFEGIDLPVLTSLDLVFSKVEWQDKEIRDKSAPPGVCLPNLHSLIPQFLARVASTLLSLNISLVDERCFTRDTQEQLSVITPNLRSLRLSHSTVGDPSLPMVGSGERDPHRAGKKEARYKWDPSSDQWSCVLGWPDWSDSIECNTMNGPELDRMSKSIQFANAIQSRKTASTIPADDFLKKLTPRLTSAANAIAKAEAKAEVKAGELEPKKPKVAPKNYKLRDTIPVPWEKLENFEWNVCHSDNFSDEAIVNFIEGRKRSRRCADIRGLSLRLCRLKELDVAQELKRLVGEGLSLQLDYAEDIQVPAAAIDSFP
ncbi:hypothetical protein FA15DRAFT_709241 [Coprinopsis marcescibilis]|uniref:Uncharacterized protein n=1 Tax=Coprinopsis marcescibilis TaxID=230819 RepID=A0A5C3KGD2_COPMA|nr:hypothetical protein FA15DRAFT_709241 [Coprinopsis marcescibilis]